MSVLHGYFSKTQQDRNGVIHIYLNNKGEKVSCTEVSKIKMNEITKLFPDNIYMGEVVSYIKSYNSGKHKIIPP